MGAFLISSENNNVLSTMIMFIENDIDLDFDEKARSFIVKRVLNISIRTTYYIFCCRNKALANPEFSNF